MEADTTAGRSLGLLAAMLLVRATGAGAATGADCLLAWRVGITTAPERVVCRDGDPACDLDGAPDGACTFATSLCLNVAGCAPGTLTGVRLGGRAAPALEPALAGVVFPVETADVCTPEAAVRVTLDGRARRTVRLSAAAVDQASGRSDRDRLRLTCQRATAALAARARAVVVTTDFETGLLATVGVAPPHRVSHPSTPIHSDAVVRVAGGRVFVVNRFLGDNLQVLDPRRGFVTLLQCSTGPGSNPHDVALVGPRKAYVTRYDARELWVVDPGVRSCARFRRGAIDLSPYGDADGLPEMDQMAVVGDRLFVSVERLDRERRFAPAGPSRLVVIDTRTDAVVGTVELTGQNVFSETAGLVREPGTGKLVVAAAGDIFKVGDGGIERVDPVALRAEGFFITEDALGGSVTDFVLISPTKGYAVVFVPENPPRNVVVAFDPSRGVVTGRLLVRQTNVPDLALAPDGTLWVADQSLPQPGIRVFDPATDHQLGGAGIDVGLPPFSMEFLP